MKLDEGEAIVDVQICTEKDDVLLTSAGGQCIRFPVTDVRVFQGRTSMGVRGIALAEGDKVISLSILRTCRPSRRARRPISSARARCGAGPTARKRARPAPRRRSGDRARRAALRRDVGGRAVRAHRRRRTATASAPRPTSTGPPAAAAKARRDGRDEERAQRRPAGRVVPGRGERPDHAGDRRRPADPLPVDGIRIAGRSTQGVIVNVARASAWSRSSASARTTPQPRTAMATENNHPKKPGGKAIAAPERPPPPRRNNQGEGGEKIG